MNRLLTLARTGLAAAPDGLLLGRFLADRDEAAFAELVRRYAPVVWGTCRRLLPRPADAEDAFQAAFLVLVRRARRAADHPALGPWLYRVAVLTARNLARANRRRPALAPLDHDVPAFDGAADRADARLDLDAALAGLSDRQRSAVVLCHLQGLSRSEAAGRLGCAEGTLSATLAVALRKLRSRLAGRDPLVILAAAGVAAPAGLSASTARTAAVYLSSAVPAGVSPAVAGLTEGVLRMFWMKKVAVAAGLLVAAAGVVAGVGVRPGAAQPDAAKAAPPKAGAKDAGDDEVARLDAQLRNLEANEADVQRKLVQVRTAREQAAHRRNWARQADARRALVGNVAYWHVELPGDGWTANPGGGSVVRITEFDGAGAFLAAYTVPADPVLLKRVFAGGLADPSGPRRATVEPKVVQLPAQSVNAVLQGCKDAGLREVVYVPDTGPTWFDERKLVGDLAGKPIGSGPVVLDLSKYGENTMAVPSPMLLDIERHNRAVDEQAGRAKKP